MRSLNELWRNGGTALGAWCTLPATAATEALARTGFDYVCVDLQHGLSGIETAVSMLQAADLGDSVPIARVPWNEPWLMHRMLDAGACGVIVPLVNTPEEAARAVDACRYAPAGSRSYGPSRVSMREGAEYFDRANDAVSVIVQIETREALDRLDDILAVPGLDCAYIGPQDLQISLGIRPGYTDQDPPAFAEALAMVVAGCEKAGVVPGIHCNAALTPKRAAQGFRMITVSSDLGSIRATAQAELTKVRSAIAG